MSDNISKETRIIKCKVCGEEKTAYLAGMYNYKDKRWKDEHGNDFNGKQCPTCHKNRIKSNMTKLRVKKNAVPI